MAKKGLGRGLGAIFGSDAKLDASGKLHHRKTVAESLAEERAGQQTAAKLEINEKRAEGFELNEKRNEGPESQEKQAGEFELNERRANESESNEKRPGEFEFNGQQTVEFEAENHPESGISESESTALPQDTTAHTEEYANKALRMAGEHPEVAAPKAEVQRQESALEKVAEQQSAQMTGEAAAQNGYIGETQAESGLPASPAEEESSGEVAEPGLTYLSLSNKALRALNGQQEQSASDSKEQRTDTGETEKDLCYIRVSLIQPNLGQPRKQFDEESLQELAESIRRFGVLQPLIVKKQGSLYEIVAGERRWRAARMAGLTVVPALIRTLDNRASREVSIIENIQRDDLNAVEEALAYQSLISEYGLTQEEVAARVSKKRSTITNSLRLLKLEPEILDMLQSGRITQGHARALLGIDDSAVRLKIAERCAREALSVREIEKLAALEKLAKEKKAKPAEEEAAEMKRLRVLYKDLERKMKSKLGTKVSIVPKDKNKGLLEIEYYSQDELDRIFTLLNSISKEA